VLFFTPTISVLLRAHMQRIRGEIASRSVLFASCFLAGRGAAHGVIARFVACSRSDYAERPSTQKCDVSLFTMATIVGTVMHAYVARGRRETLSASVSHTEEGDATISPPEYGKVRLVVEEEARGELPVVLWVEPARLSARIADWPSRLPCLGVI
jgi:hypothetical protein